jgi:hypothetical protein
MPSSPPPAVFLPVQTPPGFSPSGLDGVEKKLADEQPRVSRIISFGLPIAVLTVIIIVVVLVLSLLIRN